MLSRNARFLGCAAFLLVLSGCDAPGRTTEPPPAEEQELDARWLRENAVPFATTEPGGPTADLAPLGQMIGSARIVGLGEATHGTREFFRMKHRILEYLVRERGFEAFGIEAGWAEAAAINHYLHTGEGDPEVLLSRMGYWVWNTAEVLEMIRWMRAHNQSPGSAPRVSFYGFDVQNGRKAMRDAVAYLRGVDPPAADSAEAHYACFLAYADTSTAPPPPSYTAASVQVREQCRAGVRAVHGMLDARAEAYVPRSGCAAYDRAVRTARVAVQNEHLRTLAAADEAVATRDGYMAENVAWMADVGHPQGRLVLWAHNAHVSRWAPYMGTTLTARYGDAYRIVGFSFHSGTISAVVPGSGIRSVGVSPAVEGSYDYEFHRLGQPRFMVDLRPVRRDPTVAAAWVTGPFGFRIIGALYTPDRPYDFYMQRALPAEYDIMIHVDESTATARLPFRYE